MKTKIFHFSFFIFSFSFLLFAACGKENTGRIRILAENMGAGAKVLVDTADIVSGSSWVLGEHININGVAYPIVEGDEGFDLDVSTNTPSGDLYAVYPATTQVAGGNDIVVNNRRGSGETEITLNRLVVKYTAADHSKHETVFPMARKAAAGSGTLLFQHLTAGFKLTLKTNSSTANVASVKVVVQGTRAANAVTIDGVTYNTHWAAQGPTMPAGGVGGISGDRPVSYCSEMYFDMEEPGHDYATVGTDGIVFYVPVTIGDVKRLTVTGIAADGSQLFVQTKDMEDDGEGNYSTLTRNTMYSIPVVSF